MKLKLSLSIALLLSSSLTWAATHTGTVLETMNSGGYTYAKVMENQKEFWIAGPNAVIKTGDIIHFGEQMWMPNFNSKSLNRTFEKLLFVSNINQGSRVSTTHPSSPHANMGISQTTAASAPSKAIKIDKVADGYTVAELFSMKDALKGKTVKVQGKVVKVSNGIMKTNWIHIQDGSGSQGATDDIIFRATSATANVGDVVVAQGTVVVDQDFGFGYKYPVLVEDASFEVVK